MIRSSVTKEDFQTYWKKVKESTSSSLSGLHFGHWKVVTQNDFLSELYALFADIIIIMGYSPIRFRKGLSVMLKRILSCRDIKKLQAILLMEANFNFTNTLFYGKCMMEWTEEHGEVPRECFGGCNNHQAINVTLCRCLTLDIA